jgi:glucose-6-phosphate 1-epimerase
MHVIDIAALNRRHGIPGALEFFEGEGRLAMARIESVHGWAEAVLQGAHLTNWTPRDQSSVLWLSSQAHFGRGRPIRGGVPVCWPWFGAHAQDNALPSHGFARVSAWQVADAAALEDGSVQLTLQLPRREGQEALWPHSTPVQWRVTVGPSLEIELTTRNLGPAPVAIGEALHAYFMVGDARRVRVRGLDGCEYLDKTNDNRRMRQAGDIGFEAEVDRVYLDTDAECCLDDLLLRRRIRIAKEGSASTIVWNPWREKSQSFDDMSDDGYLSMACVETANAAENAVIVPPGGEHRLRARYSLEKLER